MIFVLCISDSHKHFSASIDEYIKRCSKSITLVCLRPSRKDDVTSVIREETTLLLEKLQKLPKPRILLEKDGKEYSSESFAQMLEKHQQSGTFILGGPYGVDVEFIKAHIDSIISFGKHTMPHGLALTVLLEQIRRAKCITEGRVYHY